MVMDSRGLDDAKTYLGPADAPARPAGLVGPQPGVGICGPGIL